MTDLDDAQLDENGRPVCGDEYCPGASDCTTCSDLRQQEWLRYETTNDAGEPTR